jgi:unsaturated rhamnogalacturonyl hydrolase
MNQVRLLSLGLLLAAPALAQTPPAPAPAATEPPAPTVAPTAVSAAQAQQIFAGRVAPAYPTPYAPATAEEIKAVLARIAGYLDVASPIKVVKFGEGNTREPVTDLTKLSGRVGFDRTDFLITSYEWGVTYAGMLLAAEATGEARYKEYAASRLLAIATVATHIKTLPPPPADATGPQRAMALRPVIAPRSLDDSGSMGAAFIKAARAGIDPAALRPWIDNYLKWIHTGQERLADGTLSRSRPLHHTLWLDDLYMSVPALAQMGALTGEQKYFDDAVKQVLQFSSRMFLPEKGFYRHGWVQAMEPHPTFPWARANGWAIVAMTELLSVLPETHPVRAAVLAQYRAHAAGLAATQGRTGLWHQLLDRNDSYLETSASAMFVYSLARGINRGWLDPLAYGPMVSLGWNAVAKQVNEKGQVENTCVGTGMGFDPMFYYYRPVSVFAAHGYGPVLLAGAEVLTLRNGKGAQANINDSSVQFAPSPSRF